MLRVITAVLFTFCLCAVSLTAGDLDPAYSSRAVIDTVPFYADGTYDPSVPIPNDFLSHPIGEWPLRYHELAPYLEAVASSSNRVLLEIHGSTYEGRDLYNLFISTEENIARLEELRQSMDRLAAGDNVDESLFDNLPAFAWLGYCVHGDELSGVDAAMQMIYQLTAGTDPATLDILSNVVVIIDPVQNPDGRERYLSMLQTYKSSVPNYNRHAMQHGGVWPWGRTNHYLFDLNRDWILLRQQETRSKVGTIVKWHPQLVIDAHEMGSNATFLFSPPREPINYNTPEHYKKWAKTFSDDQAAAFDQRGWPYYTGEWHEQWYPGYGSAWSTFFGAVGVLYEMAGVDGEFVKQQDDYLLTYHEAVNKQFTSSLANLTTLATNRRQILHDYHAARKQIVIDGRKSKLTFLFKPDRDDIKIKRFIESLTGQGIEVKQATAGFKIGSAHDVYGVKHSSEQFPAGTFIVSTAQPHGALAKAVLEFDPRLKLEFLKEERRELEKHGETRMYEVSTWSTPLAYGLDAYWTTSSFSVTAEPVTQVTVSGGRLHNPEARFGFIVDMMGEKTYQMLVRMFAENLVIRCSEKPFKLEGKDFTAGSLLLLKRGNRPELPQVLDRLAAEVGIDVWGVNTGSSTEGSYLGAGTFRLLRKPRIGIVAGDGMDYTSFGSLWYTLDQELEIPHSLINLVGLAKTDLSQYNVLIVPGSWGPLAPRLGDGGKRNIENWVRDGGTLICEGTSSVWAADTAVGLSQVRLKRQVLDKFEQYDLGLKREQQAESPEVDTIALWYPEKVKKDTVDEEKKPKLGKEEAKRQDEWQRKFHPQGVILKALLDTEDWMALGLGRSLPVILWTRHAFMAKEPVKTVARLEDENDVRLSGLLWPEARQRWANTAYATHEGKDKGQIILFAAHPNMRAYFYGSRQMFVNAVLLGPGMGSRFEGPYDEGER